MKTRNILLLFILPLLMFVTYCVSLIDFQRLNAEKEIGRRADFFITRGKVGRDCSHVNYDKINRIFDSMGRDHIGKSGLVESDFYANCMSEMILVRMNYYADYNVVSGVYRCEKNGVVQELQLSVRLDPRSVPQENDCEIGSFPRAWNIPVGEATMFHLP